MMEPDQVTRLKSFGQETLDAAFMEAAIDERRLEHLFARRKEFQVYVAAGIRRFLAEAPDYDFARTVLGRDFISPEEIAQARQLAYTEDQLSMLRDTFPAPETLEWCRDNGFILLAGPPSGMSLLDVRKLHPAYFYSKQNGWYSEQSEIFAHEHKVGAGWIMQRKEPLPNSFDKNWEEQVALLSPAETVPTAPVMMWALTTYKAVRGIYLLNSAYVRTSSRDSGGNRVRFGSFNDGGIHVGSYWDTYRNSTLGIASVLK